MNRIEVKDVKKEYLHFDKNYRIIPWLFTKKGYTSKKTVLRDVSFSVKEGEVIGVIGKNGAGKSTLMRIIAGIIFPDEGDVSINGTVSSLINLNAGLDPDFTGRENIYHKAALLGMSKKKIDEIMGDIIQFSDLGDYFDLPIRTYSSGMSARLGYALAVCSDPDILITDEVFAVGDRVFREKSREKTLELLKSGKSFIFSSHSDGLIQSFCTRVIYLCNNTIVFDGDVTEGLRLYNADNGFAESEQNN